MFQDIIKKLYKTYFSPYFHLEKNYIATTVKF